MAVSMHSLNCPHRQADVLPSRRQHHISLISPACRRRSGHRSHIQPPLQWPDRPCQLQPQTPCSTSGSISPGSSQEPFSQRVAAFQQAFWKFLRPHTIRGTILGSVSVTARTLIECREFLDWGLLPRALLGVLCLLCGNGYIVGINQIYDVDIDAVNKPFLPVAAGELSPQLAWLLVLALAVAGLALAWCNFGSPITPLYATGLVLGTVYSVPPFRLKRFAFAAFLIIATVRGFLLNFGVFTATRAALGLQFVWSPAVVFITCFVTLFATAIAITKDLADVEGDLRFKIDTFATRLGTKAVARLGTGLLMLNYVGAVAFSLQYPGHFRQWLMIGAHTVLGARLLLQLSALEAAKFSAAGIAAFYRFIWQLFYIEYALFPFL